ncbi:MAG: hypothetical protein A3G87_03300 [Omnitrophica bacterium RIFCSPLOWO2_12_FULL_50_11]|nr:MAG: hypothetical protein A3G87_03300 [Omnitrophica bacterium RIFCSPLOWO2_12_FULL_50_11]
MSTYLGVTVRPERIGSIQDLRDYFQKYAKPEGTERIGIECELFGVHRETGEALPYSGVIGIEAVLNKLASEFGYEGIHEKGHTIGLKKGNTIISLEPGGQIELSAEPISNLHQAKAQLDEFFFHLRTVAHFLGPIAWLGSGIHPFSPLNRIPWVPKQRYQIMARYLARRGRKAHDMMKRTATNQINFDYHSEEDAIEKMRLVLVVTPIAAAMFANSSLSQGKLSGYLTERLYIWQNTDPDRCGLILNMICENCKFEDYLNYVLDVPMMFIVRGAKWIVTRNLTFRKFIQNGYQGIRPTESDFELHLSTIFTDARFKQYLEIRGMDGQRSHLISSVYAFWKGILYDGEARRAAKHLVQRFREKDIRNLHQQVERLGLRARIRGERVLELARELVRISEKGLKAQRHLNEQEEDERIYLLPLKEEVLKTARTPAEQVAHLWQESFKRDRRAVIDYMAI